jgi:hypothetical protein
MTKYKQYVEKMFEDNREVFEKFTKTHSLYANEPEKWQKQFNTEGEIILDLIREYENRLCANTERGMYNKFSTQLSEKFRNEVRKIYPMIDHIGIIIDTKSDFYLKKIDVI